MSATSARQKCATQTLAWLSVAPKVSAEESEKARLEAQATGCSALPFFAQGPGVLETIRALALGAMEDAYRLLIHQTYMAADLLSLVVHSTERVQLSQRLYTVFAEQVWVTLPAESGLDSSELQVRLQKYAAAAADSMLAQTRLACLLSCYLAAFGEERCERQLAESCKDFLAQAAWRQNTTAALETDIQNVATWHHQGFAQCQQGTCSGSLRALQGESSGGSGRLDLGKNCPAEGNAAALACQRALSTGLSARGNSSTEEARRQADVQVRDAASLASGLCAAQLFPRILRGDRDLGTAERRAAAVRDATRLVESGGAYDGAGGDSATKAREKAKSVDAEEAKHMSMRLAKSGGAFQPNSPEPAETSLSEEAALKQASDALQQLRGGRTALDLKQVEPTTGRPFRHLSSVASVVTSPARALVRLANSPTESALSRKRRGVAETLLATPSVRGLLSVMSSVSDLREAETTTAMAKALVDLEIATSYGQDAGGLLASKGAVWSGTESWKDERARLDREGKRSLWDPRAQYAVAKWVLEKGKGVVSLREEMAADQKKEFGIVNAGARILQTFALSNQDDLIYRTLTRVAESVLGRARGLAASAHEMVEGEVRNVKAAAEARIPPIPRLPIRKAEEKAETYWLDAEAAREREPTRAQNLLTTASLVRGTLGAGAPTTTVLQTAIQSGLGHRLSGEQMKDAEVLLRGTSSTSNLVGKYSKKAMKEGYSRITEYGKQKVLENFGLAGEAGRTVPQVVLTKPQTLDRDIARNVEKFVQESIEADTTSDIAKVLSSYIGVRDQEEVLNEYKKVLGHYLGEAAVRQEAAQIQAIAANQPLRVEAITRLLEGLSGRGTKQRGRAEDTVEAAKSLALRALRSQLENSPQESPSKSSLHVKAQNVRDTLARLQVTNPTETTAPAVVGMKLWEASVARNREDKDRAAAAIFLFARYVVCFARILVLLALFPNSKDVGQELHQRAEREVTAIAKSAQAPAPDAEVLEKVISKSPKKVGDEAAWGVNNFKEWLTTQAPPGSRDWWLKVALGGVGLGAAGLTGKKIYDALSRGGEPPGDAEEITRMLWGGSAPQTPSQIPGAAHPAAAPTAAPAAFMASATNWSHPFSFFSGQAPAAAPYPSYPHTGFVHPGYLAPQMVAPQMVAPQMVAPQMMAPQVGAPQATAQTTAQEAQQEEKSGLLSQLGQFGAAAASGGKFMSGLDPSSLASSLMRALGGGSGAEEGADVPGLPLLAAHREAAEAPVRRELAQVPEERVPTPVAQAQEAAAASRQAKAKHRTNSGLRVPHLRPYKAR